MDHTLEQSSSPFCRNRPNLCMTPLNALIKANMNVYGCPSLEDIPQIQSGNDYVFGVIVGGVLDKEYLTNILNCQSIIFSSKEKSSDPYSITIEDPSLYENRCPEWDDAIIISIEKSDNGIDWNLTNNRDFSKGWRKITLWDHTVGGIYYIKISSFYDTVFNDILIFLPFIHPHMPYNTLHRHNIKISTLPYEDLNSTLVLELEHCITSIKRYIVIKKDYKCTQPISNIGSRYCQFCEEYMKYREEREFKELCKQNFYYIPEVSEVDNHESEQREKRMFGPSLIGVPSWLKSSINPNKKQKF